MDVQELAMKACQMSKQYLIPGISEKEFAAKCEEIMFSLGAEELWYPMLVNFNANTVYCTRGKHLPSDEVILKDNDIVLIDFSPMTQGRWGDYSETVIVGDNEQFSRLVADARHIFQSTYAFSSQSETIGELFRFSKHFIQSKGYQLLDPGGNIGHSIEDFDNQDRRIYISLENEHVSLRGKKWAIEPHIGKDGFGAKFENVIHL